MNIVLYSILEVKVEEVFLVLYLFLMYKLFHHLDRDIAAMMCHIQGNIKFRPHTLTNAPPPPLP